ncbi:hypothetical protein F5B17DRAFT_422161 [Nemania serpens]|nr:hypothetical protein F5B17DRAFT_422161 [Nemania serpens]
MRLLGDQCYRPASVPLCHPRGLSTYNIGVYLDIVVVFSPMPATAYLFRRELPLVVGVPVTGFSAVQAVTHGVGWQRRSHW